MAATYGLAAKPLRSTPVWKDSFMCVTWLIHVCDMTHSCVWHDSFIRMTWLIVWIRVTWRSHVCEVTHSYMWHCSFICVTWLIRMRDMTHSSVWHDAFIRVTWRIHTCDMTHSYVWHDSTSRCWNTDSSSITTCTTTFSTQKCTPATSDGYVRVPLWKGRGLQSRVPFSTCVSFKMLKSLD